MAIKYLMKIKGNVLIKLFTCNLTSNDSAVNKKKNGNGPAQERRTGAEDFKAATQPVKRLRISVTLTNTIHRMKSSENLY